MSAQTFNQQAASPGTPAATKANVWVDNSSVPQLKMTPPSGTVITYLDNANTVAQITNKDFADASTTISDVSATSKAVKFSLSGMTAATILTISSTQSTSQTLSVPNITGADTIDTLGLAQTITGAKTFSAALILTSASPSISKYNNITTAGSGVAFIVASAATGSVSSTQTNLINYTPPSTAGRYRLSYTIANTAGTNTGSTTPTITYVDAAGVSKSYTPPLQQEGSATWLTAATAASKNFSSVIYFSINNAGTAITATFTISGTVATFISATLEQVA